MLCCIKENCGVQIEIFVSIGLVQGLDYIFCSSSVFLDD